MKKFLGLTVLLLAVLFASCNFNNSNQKGSVDFSIPIADIVALRNEVSEPTDISPDPNQTEMEQYIFDFLVQIKGSAGYYAARYEQLDDVNYQEIEDAKFHFSFDELPVNQQYKIMIDVYNERKMSEEEKAKYEGRQGHALLIYSGDKDNIIVSAGQTTREQLVLHRIDAYSYSNFDLVLEYKDGDKTKNQAVKLDSPENIPIVFTRYEETENETTKDTYYFKDRTDSEEDQEAVYWGYKDQKKSDWTELTGLSFKLREDSHFWGDFEFVQPISKYNKETKQEEMDSVTLEFDDDGICPVYEYLSGESYLFNYPLSAQLKMDNATISTSMWVPIITIQTITFAKEETVVEPVDPEEAKEPEDDPTKEEPKEDPKEEPKDDPTTQEPTDDPTTEEPKEEPAQTNINEEIHGSLLSAEASSGTGTSESQQLVFNKRGTSNRFIYDVSLVDALNGKTLTDGDTVVFVMKVASPDSKPVTFNQFYYELRTDDWADMTDTELYAGNECINVDNSSIPKDGYYTFVMPLNSIQDPKDYNTVLFFFDGQDGTTESSLSLTVQSLDYYIFPASSNTFVFGLGRNYDDKTNTEYPYRYEFKKPLLNSKGKMYEFAGGETVRVILSGNVKSYVSSRGELTRTDFVSSNGFAGEIYDGADYKSSKYDYWQNFHPLSNTDDSVQGNVTSLTIENGAFSQSGTYVFVDIQEPFFDKDDSVETLPEHDYQFQCTSVCVNPSVLLVVENFNIVTTVTESD